MKKNFSLSGIPDLNTEQLIQRDYITSFIKEKFSLFGFMPIKTSFIEKRSNLIGNYSDSADKLVFQILRSGDYLSKIDSSVQNMSSNELSGKISDKALRYDLTVPFARFVTQNYSTITFPFKRYEIGTVWRADRPQKGRLREFVQCDADIIGDNSLWLEIDLLNLMSSIFNSIGLNTIVFKINHRKVLEGIFNSFSHNSTFFEFCNLIDKIDKLGLDKLLDLLSEQKFNDKDIQILKSLFLFEGSFDDKKKFILNTLKNNQLLTQGLDELDFIFKKSNNNLTSSNFHFDVSLARGLDYYTGTIFEAISSTNKSISLAGGGRYDNLTSKFGIDDISGVGFSLGLDRICLEMDSHKLLSMKQKSTLNVLFLNFGLKEAEKSQFYINKLRLHGISSELYPSSIKIAKQMSYGNKRLVKYVAIVGENELKTDTITIKNMSSGDQCNLIFSKLINLILENDEKDL